jgi:hypothetical protein
MFCFEPVGSAISQLDTRLNANSQPKTFYSAKKSIRCHQEPSVSTGRLFMTQHVSKISSYIGSLLLMASPLFGGGSPLPDPDGKEANMKKPVHVFILMGQSNMFGFGKINGGDGSLEHAVKNKELYPYLIDNSGKWTVRKDVRNVQVMNFKDLKNEWMTISGKSVGPEIGIGHYAGETLDAPVLILKSCIGNRSLGWDLLPPGSKPYEFGGKTEPGYRGTPGNPAGNGEKVQGEWYAGKQYDDDTESAKKVLENLGKYYPGAKDYVVAGFCFWQGAKDGGNPGHAANYEKNLVRFIKALREDFKAPNAPFVVATMGHGKKGAGGNAGAITDAQLAVDGSSGKHKEFKGNVATFYSSPVSKGGSANGHYNKHAETYMNVGEGMGAALAKLLGGFKGSSGGAGGSVDEGLFPAEEYSLCKKEVSDIKRKKAYSYILKSLDRAAKKDDEKGKQAKEFAQGLRAFSTETKDRVLEEAKAKPAFTLMNIKDHLKLLKGLDEEDALKDCEKNLSKIGNIKSLVTLYKKKVSIDITIQKRGESSFTASSIKRLVSAIKKLLEKDGLDETLKKEAEDLVAELGG